MRSAVAASAGGTTGSYREPARRVADRRGPGRLIDGNRRGARKAPRPSERQSASSPGFGYKQELDRSLGQLLVVRRGLQLHLDPDRRVRAVRVRLRAAPDPACGGRGRRVVGGQMLVALCFAELAGQYPLAGSVYQWSKQIRGRLRVVDDRLGLHHRLDRDGRRGRGRLAGRAAAGHDARSSSSAAPPTPAATARQGGAKNALHARRDPVVFATIINMLGVKMMARINNFGVIGELIGASILVILLLFHLHRGPRSSSTTSASAPATRGATSARCWSAGS